MSLTGSGSQGLPRVPGQKDLRTKRALNRLASSPYQTGAGTGGGSSTGPAGSLPVPGNAGALYLANDWPILFRDNGSSWDTFGPINALVKPPTTGWNQINFNTHSGVTTVTQDPSSGVIFLVDGSTVGEHLRLYTRTKPAIPYTLTAKYIPHLIAQPGQFNNCGICLYDGTKVEGFSWVGNGGGVAGLENRIVQSLITWANVDTGGTLLQETQIIPPMGNMVSLKVTEDASFRTWFWSADGYNWIQIAQEAANTFLTATQIGIMVDQGAGGNPTGLTLLSWQAG